MVAAAAEDAKLSFGQMHSARDKTRRRNEGRMETAAAGALYCDRVCIGL